MKSILSRPATAVLPMLVLAALPALAVKPVPVQFGQCTEFVGVASVDAVKARALVPARYTLVTDGAGAKLVVRVADCQSVQVLGLPARRGRIGQIGLIIESPDGTGTDPNTSINNYTLRYASNVPELVLDLRAGKVNATLDTSLAYEQSPASGAAEFYAAVAPELGTGPRWFLHGTVKDPTFATPFLANWWQLTGNQQTKVATVIPNILFDFSSQVSFTTSRHGPVGSLLPANEVGFPVSYRGAFDSATMLITVGP